MEDKLRLKLPPERIMGYVWHPPTEKLFAARLTVSASVFPACSLLWCSSAPANDLASSGASIGRAADKIVGGEEILPIIPPLEPAAGAMTQDWTETDGVGSGFALLRTSNKVELFLITIQFNYQSANGDRRNRSGAACQVWTLQKNRNCLNSGGKCVSSDAAEM